MLILGDVINGRKYALMSSEEKALTDFKRSNSLQSLHRRYFVLIVEMGKLLQDTYPIQLLSHIEYMIFVTFMALALGLLKEASFAMCSLTVLESKNQMTLRPNVNVTIIQESVIYLKKKISK